MYLHKKINENLIRINRLYGFWTRIHAFPPSNNGNSTLRVTTKCTEISPHPTPSPSQSDYLPGRGEHQDFSSCSRLSVTEAKFQVSVVRGEHPFFFPPSPHMCFGGSILGVALRRMWGHHSHLPWLMGCRFHIKQQAKKPGTVVISYINHSTPKRRVSLREKHSHCPQSQLHSHAQGRGGKGNIL